MAPGSENPEVDEARAELEITRARRETEALRQEMEQQTQEATKRAEVERVELENARRREDLRAYGRSLAANMPVECRQRAISMLEEFVSDTSLPPAIPGQEAHALVAARVQEIRDEYDAQRTREWDQEIERARVERLIQWGRNTAAYLTLSWDQRDAQEARAEVVRELTRCVSPDWSEANVRRRVERVLGQWEEVDEDADEDEDEGERDAEW